MHQRVSGFGAPALSAAMAPRERSLTTSSEANVKLIRESTTDPGRSLIAARYAPVKAATAELIMSSTIRGRCSARSENHAIRHIALPASKLPIYNL